MPEIRLWVQPDIEHEFTDWVASQPSGVIDVLHVDRTTYRDYQKEIAENLSAYSTRLNELTILPENPEQQQAILERFRVVIPLLSGREIFKTADISGLPEELVDWFRLSVIDQLKRSINVMPKVKNNDVPTAMGITAIEAFILYYGLDGSKPLSNAEVASKLQIRTVPITSVVGKLRKSINYEKRHKHPLSDAMWRINKTLRLQLRELILVQ